MPAGIALVLLLADAGAALAFPAPDTTVQEAAPLQGTELPASDRKDLMRQLQLVNGLAAPPGGGWTIQLRIDLQEGLTDNVLQQHSPRRFDLGTFIAPGIGIAGDTPRIKATFDFAPVLSIYTRTGSLNQLSEQMNGLASVAILPDLAYVDLRAVSGARSQYGGFGGLGTLGSATDSMLAAASGSLPSLAGNTFGVTRDNAVETASLGVSPYLVHRFSDWGIARIGYSLDFSRAHTSSGFASAPFPFGWANVQSLVTNEETVHYATGDILPRLQDSIDIDLMQKRSSTDAGFSLAAGAPDRSTRTVFSDTLSYALSRSVTLFVSGGHEDISYSGGMFAPVHDLTWALGAALKPGPDSQLTINYGHQNGFNSLSVNGHYALTARTTLTVGYGSSLGTQLEIVQAQLNQASVGEFGTLVDSHTRGPLFGNYNMLAVQDGVFRTTSLALGSRTTLDRDIISFGLLTSEQSSALIDTQSKQHATTLDANWLHQMRPDMSFSAGASLSWQNAAGFRGSGPGRNTSVVASLGWQQQISETLTTGIRYSLVNRQSEVTSYTVFQNLLIFAITKTF